MERSASLRQNPSALNTFHWQSRTRQPESDLRLVLAVTDSKSPPRLSRYSFLSKARRDLMRYVEHGKRTKSRSNEPFPPWRLSFTQMSAPRSGAYSYSTMWSRWSSCIQKSIR
jgi:hypothetical protein